MPQLEDDLVISVALLRRFQAEADVGGAGAYYGIIRRTNGDLLVHHPFSPPLDPMQSLWATDVLGSLNRELHHDGAWVVVFTDPKPAEVGETILHLGHREYGRYALIWLDADGDPQFSIEWVMNESELLDWADVLLAGIHSVMEKCHAAYTLWNTHMREVLEPAEGQTFKRARGERASSTRH